MTQKEKMLAGEIYDCGGDKELIDRWQSLPCDSLLVADAN